MSAAALHYVTKRGPLCGTGRIWRATMCLNDVSCERCFAHICRALMAPGNVASAPPAA